MPSFGTRRQCAIKGHPMNRDYPTRMRVRREAEEAREVDPLAAVTAVINALDDEHYAAEQGGSKYCREGSCAMCNVIARLNSALG